MALTKEQADRIKVDLQTIVGAAAEGKPITAEELKRWAYRRLVSWPDLLKACEGFVKLWPERDGQIKAMPEVTACWRQAKAAVAKAKS